MPHQEAVAITINSIQRQNYVLASRNATVEWSKSLQQTGTARWKMAGVDGDWVPLVGQAFGIYDTSVPGWGDPWQLGLIFAGSIDSVTPEKPAAPVQPDWLEIEVTGSSREQTLQRRLIRPFGFGYRYSRYKDMTAGAIAQAVLTDFADGENLVITPANFDDGPTIPFVAWNHQSVAEALTQLADYSEMHWWIAPDSQVYFKEREAVPAPWGIVDGDNQCQRLSIRESRENLNNAVYYRTTFGAFADDPLPEFKNPSETVIVTTPGQTFFQTEMQIQEAIDIATEIIGVEGRVPQEIEQSDGTEALFWYIPGDDGFYLTTGKTLALGTQITFHYNRLGGDVIPVEDATAISERAAIEIVGSGRYELAVANTAYTSRAAAEQRASMILQQRRNTAMVIDGETMRKGLDVGQWLVVSTSNPPINDTFLVTSVTARAVLGTPNISFSFTGVNGNKLPNGWDFFTGLGDAGFGGGFGAGFQGAGMTGGGGGTGGASLADLWREVPIGAINGTNRNFYLTHTVKPPWSLELKLNQTTQNPIRNAVQPGPIPEYLYELEQNHITYKTAPQLGDVHDASYWKDKKIIDGPPVAAELFVLTSLVVPLTYSPAIHIRAGKNPSWVYSLGADFDPEYCAPIPIEFVTEGWEERTDSAVILPMPSVADLEAMWVDCTIVGTLTGEGYTKLTVHDCWLHLTYPSGGSIDVRPTSLCATTYDAGLDPVFTCGLEFPLIIERTLYSGVSTAPTQNVKAFPIPVG